MLHFRTFVFFLLLPLSLIQLYAQDKGNKAGILPDKSSGKVAADCKKMRYEFDAINNWINLHKGKKPEIPQPPVIDPDCHDCKVAGYEDRNQAVIDRFNWKSMQPEGEMINSLLKIIKEKIILLDGHEGHGLVADYYGNADAFPCLNQFKDGDLEQMLNFLEGRLYSKITMMLDKYRNNGDYYLGGIRFYLGTLRQLNLLGYTTEDFNPGVQTWIIAYYTQYKKRLFDQNQYQLFPGIFYLPHEMELMGIDLEGFHVANRNGQPGIEQNNEVIETWNKAISFMHFKLKISYTGEGYNEDGDKATVKFDGETEIRCKPDLQHHCFTWGPEKGGTMSFKIRQVEFEGHDKEIVRYDGPADFTVPVQFNVNMCDKQPVFRMFFDRLWPEKEHYQHNQTGELNTPMIYRLVMSTLGKANSDNLQKEVAQYQETENKYSDAEMNAWNDRMEAHKNDKNYFKTVQGKKDFAIYRELQKQYGNVSSDDRQKLDKLKQLNQDIQEKMHSDPNYIGSAQYQSDKAQLDEATASSHGVMQKSTGGALTLNKLELPFRIGNRQPVNGTISNLGSSELTAIESGQLNYTGSFTIVLENSSDDRDNMNE